ncbi:MerR family transcriptional regulator [Catenuloplanes indicus]|uniref:DNA-binding transcriptional MerR regulator n=1 Tax=Catenuloplanes indicus TaxID=137267 RepID=A0AAE3VV87_9ACTN|nr:MerR family transcriptional regulator [Catenuloplanes indicus]MDQ0364257.1 DNA-binding transcriptional MerR regulator [Catenuloplanes indicus]
MKVKEDTVWRIGQLARMTGVSERTLRHYDAIGLLPPAAVTAGSGHRWYGTAELARLERIRGLQRLGLPLKQIATLAGAPDRDLHTALTGSLADLRARIAVMTAALAAAEAHLSDPSGLLPQQTTVGPRDLRVLRRRITGPSELTGLCGDTPGTLLTWLDHAAGSTPPPDPETGFQAALTVSGGHRMTLPARTVVRAVVPSTAGVPPYRNPTLRTDAEPPPASGPPRHAGMPLRAERPPGAGTSWHGNTPPGAGAPPDSAVVAAGKALFAWVDRHGLAVAGPTVEDHLVDGDGGTLTVLELTVVAKSLPPSAALADRSEDGPSAGRR